MTRSCPEHEGHFIQVDNATHAQITAVLSAGERPVTMDRAGSNARLDDAEYRREGAHLRQEREVVGAEPARGLPARRAIEWLEILAET